MGPVEHITHENLVGGLGTTLGVIGLAAISVIALRSMYKGVFSNQE